MGGKGWLAGSVGVVVLALAAEAGSSYVIGQRLAERLPERVSALAQAQPGLDLKVTRLHTGIWGSEAVVRATMTNAGSRRLREATGAGVVFRTPLTIAHGPVLWSDGAPRFGAASFQGPVRLTEATAGALRSLTAEGHTWKLPLDGTPVRLTGEVAFGGDIRLAGRSPAYEGPVASQQRADGEQTLAMTWEGGRFTTEVGPQGEAVTSTVQWPRLRLADSDLSVTLAGAHSESTFQKQAGAGFWTGEATFTLDRLRLERAAGEEERAIRLGDMHLHYGLAEKSASDYDLTLGVRSGAVALPGGETRGIRLTGTRLAMALQGIPGKTLQQAVVMSRSGGPGGFGGKPQAGLRLLRELVQAGPRLQIKELRLAGESGTIQAQGSADFGDNAPRGLHPALLLQALRADLSVTADRAMLLAAASAGSERLDAEPEEARKRLKDSLAQYIDQGLIEAEDGKLRLKARFDRGRLTINGEPATKLLMDPS